MISFLLPVVILAGDALATFPKPIDYKVVCYYSSSSGKVNKPWTFEAKNIHTNLCTHVIYGSAVLNKTSLELTAQDVKDTTTGYKSVVDQKKLDPKLKVLLSLGGKTDSTDKSGKYSKLVRSSASRLKFISKASTYLKTYKFDGLDIDWEYPAAGDKSFLTTFFKELKEAFQQKKLLLSATISADSRTINSAYDIPNLSKYLDFINVKAYDYSEGSKTTEQNAPANAALNSINYLLSKGAAPNKLIFVIPTFGKSFTLKNSNQNGFGAPVSGPGNAGPYTKKNGYLSYYEVCSEKGWTKKRNATKGAYAYKANIWVGYDDPQTVEFKSKHIINKKLGGAMIMDLSQDDFRGVCCGVKDPLLNVVNSILRKKGIAAASITCH